jgi:hypothetical protein
MANQTAASLEVLAKQARLITLGQKLLTEQPSIYEIWEHSGYSGIFIDEFLTATLVDSNLMVKCRFPIDDDADSNIGNIFISIDDEDKFVAEF